MRSSRGQLRDFKESVFWQDLCDEIDVWLEEIRNQLENPDMEFSHRVLDSLGGSAKALRNVKRLPDVLIRLLEEKEQDETETKSVSP